MQKIVRDQIGLEKKEMSTSMNQRKIKTKCKRQWKQKQNWKSENRT